ALLVHRVDAVLADEVFAGEEKLEVQPATEADNHGARNIAEGSSVAVGKQLALLVHRVDAVRTGEVRTGEEKLEGQPSAEPHNQGARNIARRSSITVGQ